MKMFFYCWRSTRRENRLELAHGVRWLTNLVFEEVWQEQFWPVSLNSSVHVGAGAYFIFRCGAIFSLASLRASPLVCALVPREVPGHLKHIYCTVCHILEFWVSLFKCFIGLGTEEFGDRLIAWLVLQSFQSLWKSLALLLKLMWESGNDKI